MDIDWAQGTPFTSERQRRLVRRLAAPDGSVIFDPHQVARLRKCACLDLPILQIRALNHGD